MKENFIKKFLIKNKIDVLIPEEEDINTINNIIFNELCLGIFNHNSKNKIIEIIQKMEKYELKRIVLGCTELGLLIKQEDLNIELFEYDINSCQRSSSFKSRINLNYFILLDN